MRIAIDTETHPIRPGDLAPQLVCASLALEDGRIVLPGWEDETQEVLTKLLERSGNQIVGHNIAFDWEVLCRRWPELEPLIRRAYQEERVYDTTIRARLESIEMGRLKVTEHSLAALAKRELGRDLAKGEDTWRLRYAELDGVPIEDWPRDAYRYAELDAVSTLEVAERQIARAGWLWRDERLHLRAAWVLQRAGVYGIPVDPLAVLDLAEQTMELVAATEAELRESGIVRTVIGKRTGRPTKQDGTVNTKLLQSIVADCYGGKKHAPKTATGRVSTDAEALGECSDPRLLPYVERAKHNKILTTYVPLLIDAVERDGRVTPGWRVLMETGRTSCADPNLQNLPRAPGVRECFVPRPGHVLIACDWTAAEMVALAQVLTWGVGESEMARALLAGRDLHLDFASQMLGIDYPTAVAAKDDPEFSVEVKAWRQRAKAANFGFPGGLGAETFRAYARGYGLELTFAEANDLRQAWLEAFPEMNVYFRHASEIADGDGIVEQPGSGRLRGGCSYTQACNSPFQGLIADAAKDLLWRLDCRPELGRLLVFVHDEVIVETSEDGAEQAVAGEIESLMVETLRDWCPDLAGAVKAEARVLERWTK